MAVARIAGSHSEAVNGDSASARTLAFGGSLTSGSILVVGVSTFNAGITLTVSDGTNGSWSQAGTYAIGGAGVSLRSSIWYFANNTATSAATVTITPSASSYISFSLEEFTGVATASPVRGSDDNSQTTASPVVTDTVTATAGDLVFCVVNPGGSATVSSVDSPFTLVTNLGSGVNEGIYTSFHTSAAGNEGCTFNVTAPLANTTSSIASFKQAIAAGILRQMINHH